MPTWHWFILIAAAFASAGLTWLVRRFVLRTKIGLSEPRERDVHAKPIPRLGGVAISLSFFVVAVVVYSLNRQALTFVPHTVWGIDANLLGILSGLIILMVTGIVDDIYGLKPLVKLACHFLAAITLAVSGVLIPHITNPFGGHIMLGAFSFLVVVVWVVVMINVINFLDGLDGLASGISLIATIVLYILALKPEVNQPSMAVLAVILIGALIGFLPFNFYPARIFMGDSGSQVLGFLLATFAIISGGKLATAFLVLGVPILDVIWVVARRIANKQAIHQADRFHLHHRLLRAGLNQREAVLLLYTISAAFGIAALETQSYGKFITLLILVIVMIIGGLALVLFTASRDRINNSDHPATP